MAKRYTYNLQLPLSISQIERLRQAADVYEMAITTLARQFIAEGLKRMDDDLPKPEKREYSDYVFHGVHMSNMDCAGYFEREYVDWMMSLDMCIIDAQGHCMQTEQNWKGKHAGQTNPYKGFYLMGGPYLTSDSPTMLEDRARGTVDWDQHRKYNSGMADPHPAEVARQDAARARKEASTAPPATQPQVNTPSEDATPKTLEQLIADD